MNRSSTVGMPSFRTPPSGFGISTRLHRLRLIGPAQQLFPDCWPVLFQVPRQLVDGHPVHASASFVGLDSCQCLLAVFPLADFLHQLFANGRAFCPTLRRKRFGPFRRPFGASPLCSSSKANSSWFFCRLSLMSRAAYSPFLLTPCGDRSGLRHLRPTLPSADFCRPVRIDCSTLSPESRTNGRSPEVSSTAFRTQPPDLQPVPLMDMGFAVSCQLARHRMPLIRFLYIGSYVCSTLLSDPASRRRPCASLSLHLHQVVKRTFTFELSNMLGTQQKSPG